MSPGTAVLSFGQGKVLLNDGLGTNILTQTTNGVFTFQLPPPEEDPSVTSPTDPDQTRWYDSNNVLLEWQTNPGIQGVSYTLDDNPSGNPDNVSEGVRTSVSYDNVPDGVHYFHIKAMEAGIWGGVTTYAVMTDATPPASFDVVASPSSETTDQHPVFSFGTTDVASGIDHYELKVVPLNPSLAAASDGDSSFFVETDSPYTQALDYGDYDVYVRAYDRAGNYTQEVQRITVTNSVFEVVATRGLRLGGLTVPWLYAGFVSIVILILLVLLALRMWRRHRQIEEILRKGAEAHPDIAAKIAELHRRRNEYGDHAKVSVVLLAVALSVAALWGTARVHAADVLALGISPTVASSSAPAEIGRDWRLIRPSSTWCRRLFRTTRFCTLAVGRTFPTRRSSSTLKKPKPVRRSTPPRSRGATGIGSIRSRSFSTRGITSRGQS